MIVLVITTMMTLLIDVNVDDFDERHLVLGKQEGVDVTQSDHRQADHNEGLHMI